MLGTLDAEVGHLALDDTGKRPQPALGSSRSAISRVPRCSVLAAGSGGNGRLADGADLAADDP
jgi:hypothetical protein